MDMVAPLYYTADMVRTLPDDAKRYETVHGEWLVTPAVVTPAGYGRYPRRKSEHNRGVSDSRGRSEEGR